MPAKNEKYTIGSIELGHWRQCVNFFYQCRKGVKKNSTCLLSGGEGTKKVDKFLGQNVKNIKHVLKILFFYLHSRLSTDSNEIFNKKKQKKIDFISFLVPKGMIRTEGQSFLMCIIIFSVMPLATHNQLYSKQIIFFQTYLRPYRALY